MLNIAITGGSGFIGNELTKQLIKNEKVERIIIISRGEAKQSSMKTSFPDGAGSKLRYFIGDARDYNRLCQAFREVDCVIHCAALKRVEVCEYDPIEAVQTNVLGAVNVVNACNATGVKKCILTSTDKACMPDTLYGGTKFCAERIFTAANNLGSCRFSSCRYANVEGSTGSVIPIWKHTLALDGTIDITDKRMTRMWITQEHAARFVLDRLESMEGGEVFIPDLKGETLLDTAKRCCGYGNYCIETSDPHSFNEIGIRPNEKLHETLISDADSRNCYKTDDYYTIYPAFHDWRVKFPKKGTKMPESFRLSSDGPKADTDWGKE